MKSRRHTKLAREGNYAAEVDVELIEAEDGWSPYLSLDDARKLDAVREALRRGDIPPRARRTDGGLSTSVAADPSRTGAPRSRPGSRAALPRRNTSSFGLG